MDDKAKETGDNIHAPESLKFLERGTYKLETFMYNADRSVDNYEIAGSRTFREEIGMVLRKDNDIYTAVVDYNRYLINYLAAFGALSKDKILTFDDSAAGISSKGTKPLALGAAELLGRLSANQAYLRPGRSYMIADDMSHSQDGIGVHLLYDTGDEKGTMVLHAFVEPTSAEPETLPYAQRLRNFFGKRAAKQLTVSQALPAILDVTNMNWFFNAMHAESERPALEKGTVYVLDDVQAKGDYNVFVYYHDFRHDEEVAPFLIEDIGKLRLDDIAELDEYLRVLVLDAFPDWSTWAGRRQNEIVDFFRHHLSNGTALFSPVDNIYANAMDYMKSPLADSSIPQPILFRLYRDGRGGTMRHMVEENARILREDAMAPTPNPGSYTAYNKKYGPIGFPRRVP